MQAIRWYNPPMEQRRAATLVVGEANEAELEPGPLPPEGPDVSRALELEAVLARYRGRRLVVFVKGYPDPDAIASALAHQYLCRNLGVDTDIIHFEDLSHHENKALVKRLEIEMTRWSPELDLSVYDGYCLVDTQSPELPIERPDHLRLVSLVDHHRSIGPIDGDFIDVREDAGSTAALYAEYLASGEVGLDASSSDSVRLATALMHGIRADTDDFLAARPIDFKASAFLAPFIDREFLQIISQQSISSKSMDILQVALDKKILKGTYMIAGVGHVREEDRDGIGEAADYLLRREGVDTVLVYGIVGGEIIDGSLRTTSSTVDPDKWMKDMFGLDRSGRYYGGGRNDKGGFQIPLGVFEHCTDRDLLWRTVCHTVEDRFFEKIGSGRDGT
jgi:nanoRNase/pAp phosphatase (c-di-AMP/oligoRNAs hydrolase)